MLIKFYGQNINGFFIPPFTLSKGELVVINILDGAHHYPLKMNLIKILTGNVVNDNVEIFERFKYVEHFKEGNFRSTFFPISVGRYHQKFANANNSIYKKIYDIKWMTPQINVKTLAGGARLWLFLYTTLSHTNNIIFDLVGVDPQGG